MQFNSIEFLCFFPIVFLVFYILPCKVRKVWLLLSSYFFYMFWNPKYIVLIVFSTLVTFFMAKLIEKSDSKKAWLIICLIVNLAILLVFKYSTFVIGNINALLNILGITGISKRFDFLLPVGISFYTFQTLGYVIDVYRGETKAEKDFVKYALFVSFFPQLVAGPIERSKNLLHQLDFISSKENKRTYQELSSGFSLICFGMFQKMVIADRMANFVDYAWNNLQMIGLTEGIFVAVAFSIQIYCDFSAYSSIAIGCARLFGISLMENFNTPYFAVSIKDFWRRWHISLSIWFRDYLYIPLGGNRCSKAKKYRNVLITFAVSGLWHGANWTYILWGLLHGIYQVVGEILEPIRSKLRVAVNQNESAESTKIFRIIGTYILTTFAWIFFRAPSLKSALSFLRRMLTKPNPWAVFDGSLYNFGIDTTDYHVLIFSMLALILVSIIRYKKNEDFGSFMARQGTIFRWIVLICLILGCIIYGAYGVAFDSSQFIYFQF